MVKYYIFCYSNTKASRRDIEKLWNYIKDAEFFTAKNPKVIRDDKLAHFVKASTSILFSAGHDWIHFCAVDSLGIKKQ